MAGLIARARCLPAAVIISSDQLNNADPSTLNQYRRCVRQVRVNPRTIDVPLVASLPGVEKLIGEVPVGSLEDLLDVARMPSLQSVNLSIFLDEVAASEHLAYPLKDDVLIGVVRSILTNFITTYCSSGHHLENARFQFTFLDQGTQIPLVLEMVIDHGQVSLFIPPSLIHSFMTDGLVTALQAIDDCTPIHSLSINSESLAIDFLENR